MRHNLSKSEPLSLSEIQFIEDFINKNMSSSVPKHYIKDGHFNVNLLIGLLLGSLCELDGTFSFTNGVMRLIFGNKKGEIDLQHSNEASLMKFIEYISQLSNYYVASLLDNSFNVQLLENDVMVDYADADSSTHYYAVWMPFYEVIKISFKHAALKIQAMPDANIKARAINSFDTLESYITKTLYQFEEFEVFAKQFPQIAIDLYQFRLSMVTDSHPLNNKQPTSLSHQTLQVGIKVGRNDLCPCGSGKKYKNCCINVSSTVH